MEEYIKKSVLVAELKKRFDYRVNGLKAINDGTFLDEDQSENEFNAELSRCAYNAVKNEVFELMCFLDTFEVKEVDLEKAIDDYIYTNNGRKRMALELDWKQCDITFNAGKLIIFAKHFFELGLKAQKGEEV